MAAAISVENLGKCYRINHESRTSSRRYRTVRDSLANAAASAFRYVKNRGAVSVIADDFWALREVAFEIKSGEVVGIMGRNGAGKSTLLKILSRVAKPTTGSIRLRGRVGSLLEVGTGFHPELTGRENVYLNGSILGMQVSEIRRRFDQIVDFSGVEPFIDTPVKRYSSGMQVRLAFAVAAHLEPEILIVDEVLAVGDVGFQEKCLATSAADAPTRSYTASSANSTDTLFARSSESSLPSGTRSPLSPGVMISGMANAWRPITGKPRASASTNTMPKPSKREGSTKRSCSS